jgi:hypothetical protein
MKTPLFFKFNPSILIDGRRLLKIKVIENEVIANIVEVPLVGPAANQKEIL